jgi:hypothetical protein
LLRKETHNILENQPWWFKQTAAKLGTPFRGVSRPCVVLRTTMVCSQKIGA